ncbi:MAG TPA: virginiamycin B lyase, partial [Streptomyces sp.]
ARITPTGDITPYPLPTPSSEPHAITCGPDGTLWTALEIGTIARVTPATEAP